MIKRGTLEVGSIFRGSTVISKVYRGTTVIYELADGTYLELIEDITVGTAVTSVQFSGFTATKEDSLVLVSDWKNALATGQNTYLYVNNNQTNTNYYTQLLVADGTTVIGARTNESRVAPAIASQNTLSFIDIKLTNDGYFSYQSHNSREYNTTGIDIYDNYVSSTFTMTSITQLNVVSLSANAIGIGSRFTLYRLVGA